MAINDVGREIEELILNGVSSASGPAQKAISLRLPVHMLAKLDALRDHAEVSRQFMALKLLQLGIESVMQNLPLDVQAQINSSVWGYEDAAKRGNT